MQIELIRQVQTELGSRSSLRAAASYYFAAAIADRLLAPEASPDALRRSFRTDRRATIERLLPQAQSWFRAQLPEQLSALRAAGIPSSALPDSSFAESEYLERVVHLALERVLINAAAPPLLISPIPDPEQEPSWHAKTVLAIVFDHPLAITHELYPLWTDAYVFSLNERSVPPFELIGIHNSWLDADARIRRAIFFQPDRDLFVEAPLQSPALIAAALLIGQSPESHQAISRRLTDLDIPHVNPSGPASTADDKWRCFALWKRAGLSSPPTCHVGRNVSPDAARATIRDFIRRHPDFRHGWFVQPRHGTEGAQVVWVADGRDLQEEVLQTWKAIAPEDDAILRPRIGLVCLQCPDGPRPFDLRLHVCFDGIRYDAESGYLQVAPSADAPVSSTGRGGQIQPLSRLAAAELVCLDRPSAPPFRWRPEFLESARELAIRSVRALGPLGLAGVDIKLDWKQGRLTPAVLDLNPRPAGLLHASLLSGGDPGIGTGLWRRMLAPHP